MGFNVVTPVDAWHGNLMTKRGPRNFYNYVIIRMQSTKKNYNNCLCSVLLTGGGIYGKMEVYLPQSHKNVYAISINEVYLVP